MARCKSRMAGVLQTIVLFLILFIEWGKSEGDTYANLKDDVIAPLPAEVTGWWGENKIEREVWRSRGSSALLPCQIPNLESLLIKPGGNVTWLKNNETLPNRRRSRVTPDGHLNITKLVRRRSRNMAAESDDGEYRCLVTIMTTDDVPWIVSSMPILLHIADIGRYAVLSPSDTSLIEGEAMRFHCHINSQPAPHYTWFRNGEPLPRGDSVRKLNDSTSSILQISNVQSSQAGSYKCRATNQLLNKTRESNLVEVTVKNIEFRHSAFLPPVFLYPKMNTTVVVVEGHTTTLECFTTGLPIPTVTWYQLVATAEGEITLKDIEHEEFTVDDVGNLHLSNAYSHHTGTYVCKAKSLNPVSEDYSIIVKQTKLKVLRPPIIARPLKNVTKFIARTVRLECPLTQYDGLSDIAWYKNGRRIITDTRLVIREKNELVFINSITKDTGVYQCIVINQAGFATSWSYLLVNSAQDHPYPPQKLRYVLLSPTSAILSWDKVQSFTSPIVAYSVHYIKLGTEHKEYQIIAKNNSLLITSLIPHTNYYFQVRAYNAQASDLSDKLYFKTKEDVPTSMPEFELQSISPRTLLVTWKPLLPETARGVVTLYKVQWKRRSKSYYNLNEVKAPLLSFNVTDLHPGKSYKVRVSARTSAGYNEEDSGWKHVTMPEVNANPWLSLPKAPLLELRVIDEDSKLKKINVNWTQPTNDRAKVNEYVVKYKRRDEFWSEDIKLPGTVNTYVVENLEPDWYRVRVRGVNAVGEGPPTVEVINAQVLAEHSNPSKMPYIVQVNVSVISQTIMKLSWTVRRSDDQNIAFYTICQREVGTLEDVRPVYRRSTRSSISINGLTAFTDYEFSIRAHVSDTEFGPYSDPIHSNPMHDNVSAPREVNFEPIDASTIEIKWDSIEAKSGPLNKYQVIYTFDDSLPLTSWKQKDIDGVELESKISGLVSNTKYWFRVRGCSDMSCGSFSEPLVVYISAILPPDTKSSSQYYLIVGLVSTLGILIVGAFLAMYILKFRSRSSPPMTLSCNGNGIIKHSDGTSGVQNSHGGRNGTVADINGTDGDYIPMLNRIHTDLPPSNLDTKGGYPTTRLNGFTNHRSNGVVRNMDLHYGTSVNSGKAIDSEESEHLYTPSAASSVHSRTGDALKSSGPDINTQKNPLYNT